MQNGILMIFSLFFVAAVPTKYMTIDSGYFEWKYHNMVTLYSIFNEPYLIQCIKLTFGTANWKKIYKNTAHYISNLLPYEPRTTPNNYIKQIKKSKYIENMQENSISDGLAAWEMDLLQNSNSMELRILAFTSNLFSFFLGL